MSEKLNNKNDYNWGDIEKDIINETPREINFSDCYTNDDIRGDREKVNEIKERLGIKKEFGISDSRIQEYATQQEIGEMDWFGEEERADELFPEGKGSQSMTFLSSEFDDYTNHIDMICVMNNADSDFESIPFAIDITYNQDQDNLDKKFSWEHPLVKQKGFATAKYFEDTYSFKEPLLEKGRIPIMPRFIIGFNPDLAEEITKCRMSVDDGGWNSLRREELSIKAKWCVLSELKTQSEQMLEFLNQHHNDHELLKKAYEQVKALDTYFSKAIIAAKEKDKKHPDWQSYVETDEVAQKLLSRDIV